MIIKRKRQNKCVKAYTEKITDSNEIAIIIALFNTYRKCLNYFYQRLGGIKSMMIIKKWRQIRNSLVAERKEILQNRQQGIIEKRITFEERYHIPTKLWQQSLQQACMNLNSMWTNLGNRLKKQVQNNDNFTDGERAYLNYVFSAREIWQDILLKKEQTYYLTHLSNDNLKYLSLRNALNNDQLHHLQNYIRRVTYKHLPHPHSKKCFAISLEQNNYRIYTKNKQDYINFCTLTPRKRLAFPLTGDFCYRKTGNIMLIWDENRQRIEIHKNIKARTPQKQHWQKKDCGVDKGLHNILSNDDGQEFGINYSQTANQEAQRIVNRSKHRNSYIQSKKKLKKQIHNLREKLNQSMNKNRIVKTIASLKSNERQLQHLLDHNIGERIHTKQNDRGRANNKSLIGHAVRQMYLAEKPTRLAKEDLTFTKNKQKTKIKWKAKLDNRLNSWYKGYLDDRLTYQGGYYHVTVQDVNPAYTSQFCPFCGAKILKRKGKHKEIAVCPNCGEFNANTGAAKNIKEELYDEDIDIYTPYKEVKKIRETRYNQRVKEKKYLAMI